MKRFSFIWPLLLASLLAFERAASGQTQVSLTAPAPSNVTNVSATGGAAGSNTYWYWVVAVYPIGKVNPSPAAIAISRATPTAGVPITISWSGVAGATSYDVLKTFTSAVPTGACACALATGNTTGSTTDTGGALSAYTVTAVSGATGTISLDNQTASSPFVNVNIASAAGNTNYKMALIPPAGTTGQCLIVGGTTVGNCVFSDTANTYTGGGLQDLGAVKFKPPILTVATLPAAAAGNINQIYVVTDGLTTGDCTVGGGSARALCVSTGSTWTSLGGSSSSPNIATILRPTPGNFAWVNQGAATLTTTGGGLNITGAGAAGTNVRAQVATPGTPTFSCTMDISVMLVTGNQRAGALMRESVTGKLLSFAGGGAGTTAILIDRWASATSFTGTQASYVATLPVFSNGFWVRATYDGTNAQWYLSPDGVNFSLVYTEVATSSFTTAPDQCGIFFDSEGAGSPPQSVTLLSYAN